MSVDLSFKKRISLLICTIPERAEMFNKLSYKVVHQAFICNQVHPTLGDVEIIVDDSKRFTDGGPSIGGKRQHLLDKSTGDYICYLDDDEDISPDYIETILRLCYEDKDVCTFKSISKLANNWALVDMRLGNPTEQINPNAITLRPPWHVCPVRREFAQQFKFENSNYGEDWIWFKQVLNLCQTEAHTDKIIHNYNHGAHSEADKIK